MYTTRSDHQQSNSTRNSAIDEKVFPLDIGFLRNSRHQLQLCELAHAMNCYIS